MSSPQQHQQLHTIPPGLTNIDPALEGVVKNFMRSEKYARKIKYIVRATSVPGRQSKCFYYCYHYELISDQSQHTKGGKRSAPIILFRRSNNCRWGLFIRLQVRTSDGIDTAGNKDLEDKLDARRGRVQQPLLDRPLDEGLWNCTQTGRQLAQGPMDQVRKVRSIIFCCSTALSIEDLITNS